MKFLDFFAGIGGFRRGMELAGHKCVGFCEFDKFATASYISMHLITEEQKAYLETLSMNKRQKEILKDEYRNGEWYANDIRSVDAGNLPAADCWCFGAPCQDFSVAGKRAGLDGDRSSLIREIFRLLEEQKEENRPEWLIYENVKGMFSSNRGLDYLSILSEMDRLGYDIEWQNINSKWFVPQNRERIYTIGHLRGRSSGKVFPITGTDGESSVSIVAHRDGYRRNTQTFSPDGITEALSTCQGGGREHHVAIKVIGSTKPKLHSLEDIHDSDGIMSCLNGRDYKCPKQVAIPVLTPEREKKRQNGRRFKENGEPMFTITSQDRHGVAVGIDAVLDTELVNISGNTITDEGDISHCLNANDQRVSLKIKEATKQGYAVAHEGDSINLAVPDSKTRRGRVGKEVAQTLDTSCNQGIFVQVSDELTVYAIWYEKYQCYIAIRKLTPKECFRLQGWTDDYFEKAAFVNSDSQLYKQAGNGVTVDVVHAIAKKLNLNLQIL